MIIQITIIMGIKNLINLLMKRKKNMDTNNLTNKNMMTILTNKAMSIIILFKEIMVDVQTVINVLKVNAVLNGDIAVQVFFSYYQDMLIAKLKIIHNKMENVIMMEIANMDIVN